MTFADGDWCLESGMELERTGSHAQSVEWELCGLSWVLVSLAGYQSQHCLSMWNLLHHKRIVKIR